MMKKLKAWRLLLPLVVVFCCSGSLSFAELPQPVAGDYAGIFSSHHVDAIERKKFLQSAKPQALAVLRYWFEEWDEDTRQGGKGRYNDKWFPHGPKGAEGSKLVDAEIRSQFMATFKDLLSGKEQWDIDNNPFDNLAYVLVFDQFTRNMFRGQDQAYQHDNLSRDAAKRNIEQGFYNYYFTGYQKLFIVYPLMHHEDLNSQMMSLQYLKAINEHPAHRYEFLNALQKGVEHYQVVFMFDRFPHRNVRRDRKNTANETVYLSKQGTPGFVDGSKW